jgi:transcriptional regulator with XRE-family HTH domain
MKDNRPAQPQVRRLHTFIESVCGLYSRVARRLNISPSFVSRVARGERQSPTVEKALLQEFDNVSTELLEAPATGPAGQ